MAITLSKKQISRRFGAYGQFFIVFVVSLLLSIRQFFVVSSRSSWASIYGSNQETVDYPVQSILPQLSSANSSISTVLLSLPEVLEPTTSDANITYCREKQEWYSKPHIGNLDLGKAFAHVAISSNPLSGIDNLLDQTICHKDGRFRTITAASWNPSDPDMLNDWAIKLMYLAIHDLFHRPARQEHHERSQCPSQMFPSFEYQCHDAKYMICGLPGIGMGASIRLSAVSDVILAIAHDRIPLFVAKLDAGQAFTREFSQLFSCDRRDPQCIFLPMSPCTVHLSDLENRHEFTEPEMRFSRKRGQFPGTLGDDRVIMYKPKTLAGGFAQDPVFMGAVRKKLADRALLLIDEWYASLPAHNDETNSKLRFLKAAAQDITTDRPIPENGYSYLQVANRASHVVLMYLLRTNPMAQASLNKQLSEILPPPISSEFTVGLPIRGSDKCYAESTCLPFSRYMDLAKETWQNVSKMFPGESATTRGKLILTTEDRNIFDQRLGYTEDTGYPLDIVVNGLDPMQSSGRAHTFRNSADHIVISSLLALQMQLHSSHLYGNCCSNFHLMLFDLAKEGCGLTKQAVCLQETADYRVCCMWRNDEGCDEIKREFFANFERETNNALAESRKRMNLTGGETF